LSVNKDLPQDAVVPSINRRGILAGGICISGLLLAGCAPGASTSLGASRIIPFSLWTGVDGAVFGAPVDVTVESRTIRGPFDWRHPATGETLRVYERINREKTGDKIQYFTLNADNSALARVFDSRPGQADRTFTGDAFFPLGRWRDDERRSYRMTTHQNGRSRDYDAQIRIRRLSGEYRGVAGSLRYDWSLTDLNGAKVFDERYDYSPGVGFVRFQNRMA
jgi:hypothetical protein